MIYKKWEHHLDGNIELRPIELAGRGSRIQDPLYKDFNDMVEDVFHQIKACLLYTSPSPRDQRGSRMPSSA